MDALVKSLKADMNVETVFKIPIFGGIPVYESVVVTWIIIAAVLIVCLLLTRNLSVEHPGKRQIALESFIEWLYKFFGETIGEKGKRYVPYLVSVLIYIAISNLIGIIGLRTNVLTASQGEAIMAHRFKEYQPYKGDIQRRTNGSMIAMEGGTAYAYSIDHLQDRGRFFIHPQDEVYAGQVVGEHVHEKDLVINVTKAKQLTNMRASGSDDKARIIPPVIFSLEEALEYIKEDEYVEVTPKSMRMRKVILDQGHQHLRISRQEGGL